MIKITKADCVGLDDCYCNWYRCPNCSKDFINRDHHYCPRCGEKIEWDGVEE